MARPLPADVVVLTSRFAPDLDGGYAVAVLSRLLAVQHAGAPRPLLLTVDAASPSDHERAVARVTDMGVPAGSFAMRNLFDEVLHDSSWLWARAQPGERTGGLSYRELRDAEGTLVVSLPIVDDPSAWYLSDAHIVVHHPDGDRVLPGFGALYVAWLSHVADGLRAAAGDEERNLIVICESRQVGEVLDRWCDPRVRIVHTVHNSHLACPFDRSAPVRDDAWQRWLDGLDRFDLVLWPTRAQSRDVSERFPHRVRFGSVPSAILPRSASRLAPRSRSDVVVMASRLVDQKRIDLAVRAWPAVLRRRPSARLDIYGRGPLHDHLESLIRENGLEGSVRLRGHRDDVRSAMDDARVFLSTSAFEGQGLAIVEAMSSGLPVVSFDVRYGPAEIVDAGGILVAPGDVEGISAAVIALLEDGERWNVMSQEARGAAARFTPAAVAARLREELEEVLMRPAGRLCTPLRA